MASTEKFELTIPSETAAGHDVQERIVGALAKLEYPERDIFGVRLALEEALVNAIKHGNRMDPAKHVRVDCCINSTRVQIIIEDEGDGFSPDFVPDPTEESNLERPCGRGIMLMRAFLSSVEYNEKGNRVLLVKNKNNSTPDNPDGV